MLNIDIETYCEIDIKVGVYKYVENPSFEILLFAYAFENEDVVCVDLKSGEQLPERVMNALKDNTIKKAFNAQFERLCLNKQFGLNMDASNWRCTMIQCFYLGMPFGLDEASKILKVAEKDKAGKALIQYFSKPCKPTKVNGGRLRNNPEHDEEKWGNFKTYCIKDVVAEVEIGRKLSFFKQPEFEYKMWELDQKINDKGVKVDIQFAKKVIRLNDEYLAKLNKEAYLITKLDNPNSPTQLKAWLEEEIGKELENVNKETIKSIKEDEDLPLDVQRMAQIRAENSKTSVKKYQSMLNSASSVDDRLRGLHQYYGACRTGRFAGRIVQPQNLPQNHLKDIANAKYIVDSSELDVVELIFGNPPDTFSQLIRPTFIAAEGKKLIISDFAAIEARVIAWLAKEEWRMEVFATHGKIYETSVAAMFNIPAQPIIDGYDNKGSMPFAEANALRQKGKVAELALGYQGGAGALIQMGALKMGLTEEELQPIVTAWRKASPNIVKFWNDCNRAAIEAVRLKKLTVVNRGIKFFTKNGFLFISLPSGRYLAYPSPEIGLNQWGNPELSCMAQDQITRKWSRKKLYGGLIVENLCQAVARDCLVETLLKLDKLGYDCVMHVHDEVVLEVPEDFGSVKEVEAIMAEPIEWAKDLLLKAKGSESKIYEK